MTARPDFRAGRDSAMKVPAPQDDATVAFYRDVLGLKPLQAAPHALGFRFGDQTLWIDRCTGIGQTKPWLDAACGDPDAVPVCLQAQSVPGCEGTLPAFWARNPASVVRLVCKADASWT